MKLLPSRLPFLLAASILFSSASSYAQSVSVNEDVPSLTECPNVKVKVKERCAEAVAAATTEAVQQSLAALENLSEINVTVNMEREAGLTMMRTRTSTQAAEPFAHEKEKKVNRTFRVKSTDKLYIENQFGQVDVQTWDRSGIVVEVNIVTRAETEAKAQEILDKISIRVNEDKGNNLISFVTEREPMQIRSSTQKSFEINYVVKMPKGNPLQINNKYGAVELPALDGPTEISVKYGKLTAGALNNRHNRISVEYSSGECLLDYMKAGDLNVKYSTLRLNGGENINANTAYSRVGIDKVDELNVESRYDRMFKIGSVNHVNGKGSYSSFSIDNLKESMGMELRYCSKFEIGSIAHNFKKVDVNSGYTSVKLGFADNSAFNFDVNTAYSNLKVDQDLVDFSFREVKNTSASYKGKFGKASPKGIVSVNSKYGSVQFY